MAKRPTPAEPNEPEFQIPEVAPIVPEKPLPITDIAASIPSVPPGGAAPSSPPPTPKAKFTPPSKAKDFDPTKHQTVRRGQLKNVMVLYPPAHSRFSTVGTSLFGDCAIANGLGNREPIKVFVSFNEEATICFLMPVGPKATRGVDVTYHEKRAVISLWSAFEEMAKAVQDGFKQIYALELTDSPVTIHETTGYALYFSLEDFEVQKIHPREPGVAGTTKTKSGGKAKKTEPSATAGQGGSTDQQASATVESGQSAETMDEEALIDDGYEDMLQERDDKIKALEKKLKAYEKKHGQQ